MEKRVFLVLALFLLVSSLSIVSAEIIFNSPVKDIYNIDDVEDLSVTFKALSDVSGNFKMFLICSGKQTSFYQNGVSLKAGEEKTMEASLIFNKENGIIVGECTVKAIVGSEYKVTEDFEVSDSIIIQSKVEQVEFNPGEGMVAKGDAVKKNGEAVNGFADLKVVIGNNNSTVEQLGTVNNGFFSVNAFLPENLAAGSYLVNLEIYEVSSNEEKTNKGFMSYNIKVNQVPTSLEVFVENKNVEPGTKLRTKTILHDQTGESIPATSIITIKKSKNDILQQTEVATDEFIEVDIPYNEPPANWTIVGISSQLSGEIFLTIEEKKEILIKLINETVLVSNKGNVPYNGSILLKIGEDSVPIEVYLEVDGFVKYKLSAPDGEYVVEVISNGESRLNENVLLTGRAVGVKESGSSGFRWVNFIVWVFAILILGAVGFLIYRKGKKGFFHGFKKKPKSPSLSPETPKTKMKEIPVNNFGKKAVLSLSIKGEKHEAAIVCLRIKNLSDLKKEGIKDTMKKVDNLIEGKKVFVYENQESLFFIFSPVKTKTFRNEKDAIKLAQELKEILVSHNKIFKYKIDFGISVNNGYIVSRLNHKRELEFVGMGSIIASSRKVANSANKDIFLSKEAKDKAGGMIKTDARTIDGTKVYTIREMREREQYKDFIRNFLRSQERDKEEKRKREERKKEREDKEEKEE